MTQSINIAEPEHSGHRLEYFPIPFFASVMGLSGMTLALHVAELQAGWPPLASSAALALTVAVFVGLSAIYTLKALRYPNAVAQEWRHPVKLSFFPALTISLLLIATALQAVQPGIARALWVVGALGQAGLTLAVLSNWIGHRPFQTVHISPAWFIPAVGNVVAPVAGVSLGFVESSWVFFAAGLVFWMVLLVLVMNRLIFHDPLPGRMVPTIAILIAPPAVAFLSWLQLNGGVLDATARLFYGTTIVFALLALTQVPKLRGQSFALSWWALSFPVATLTIATFRFGTLAGSPAHTTAGFACLALLVVIVAVLIGLTARAVARHEICQPE
ncbi:SLAC1 anion channel family protein [Maliponia aquimaris]|uniref:Tellurite resistance protein TehA n=1 Tax=Maliponia aquimaris TaxID=1673631 RepID=A0A238L129_9RHOB|nr:SLAC1 anion channel family protein [Maliponia aquimaris]SMX48036.1 Tellurite resistance protein TehA [Maliponia aquimaris]